MLWTHLLLVPVGPEGRVRVSGPGFVSVRDPGQCECIAAALSVLDGDVKSRTVQGEADGSHRWAKAGEERGVPSIGRAMRMCSSIGKPS
jgi:hypothetical protein